MLSEKERAGLKSLADLAKALGVNYQSLYTRMQRGCFEAPTHTANGHGRWKYYTQAEFDAIYSRYQARGEN